jgi:hypothetical protein
MVGLPDETQKAQEGPLEPTEQILLLPHVLAERRTPTGAVRSTLQMGSLGQPEDTRTVSVLNLEPSCSPNMKLPLGAGNSVPLRFDSLSAVPDQS